MCEHVQSILWNASATTNVLFLVHAGDSADSQKNRSYTLFPLPFLFMRSCRWNIGGMENGMERWMYTVALFNQGWVSHYVCRALNYLITETVWTSPMLPAFFLAWYRTVLVRKWDFPNSAPETSYSILCMGVMLTTVKEGCYYAHLLLLTNGTTKVARQRHKWKDWASRTNFC